MAAGVLACTACEHAQPSLLPVGPAAYAEMNRLAGGAAGEAANDEIVRINDRLAIRVLGEPELTSDFYRVDGNGLVQVPLGGEIEAAGRTTSQIKAELVKRLSARYIRDPQVAVIVVERARISFAVEGEVREPGIFDATAGATLLSALAQAKSPTNVARLDQVLIFRVVEGQRMGARFNLSDIRSGRADDPRIIAGDTIVVGHSDAKAAWREFIQAAPAFSLFYYLKSF